MTASELDQELEERILGRVRRRRWETVDAAVRWAMADSTSPQGARAIDLSSMALTVPDLRKRTVTVRSTGQRGGASPYHQEAAADRGQVLAIVLQLEEVQRNILVASAFGYSQRDISEALRAQRGSWDSSRTHVHLRYARERVERRLLELGYLTPR